jgi:hypothetical protein
LWEYGSKYEIDFTGDKDKNNKSTRQQIDKPLAWKLKAVGDALNLAVNEGLDGTIGGRLTPEQSQSIISLAKNVTNEVRFSKKEQIVYWQVECSIEFIIFLSSRRGSPKYYCVYLQGLLCSENSKVEKIFRGFHVSSLVISSS